MSRHVIYTHFAVRGSGCLTLKLSATFQAAHRENRIVSTGPSVVSPFSPPPLPPPFFLSVFIAAPRSIDNYADYDQHREPITAADRFHFHNSRRFRPFQRATDALFLKTSNGCSCN